MSFWDPVAFSWPIMIALIVGTILLTIGAIVWYVLLPDEPEFSTKKLVTKAVNRDRREANSIAHHLDAESGRDDATTPDPR